MRLRSSGARYTTELEETVVAAHFGYQFFGEWDQMDVTEREYLIAAFRVDRTLQAAEIQFNRPRPKKPKGKPQAYRPPED